MAMVKVGLVGENPNDTVAIENLLNQEFSGRCRFETMIKRINGSRLDDQKTKHLLRKSFEKLNPDIVCFIRDLDALKANKAQLALRKSYFTENNSIVNGCGVYLLHIWEIEAFILADVEVFNRKFGTKLTQQKDVMLIPEPKEVLENASKGDYHEYDCPELLANVSYEKLKQHCQYFADFLTTFTSQVSARNSD